jgi:hypothetical protein
MKENNELIEGKNMQKENGDLVTDKIFKRKEYMKEYQNRPEVKERIREYKRKYAKEYHNRPEVKERIREYVKEYQNRPEVKEKVKERMKEYHNRPEVIIKRNERIKKVYYEQKIIKSLLINDKEYLENLTIKIMSGIIQ